MKAFFSWPVGWRWWLLGALGCTGALRADWQRTETTLAWATEGRVVWQFSFDPAKGKAFFHPLAVGGGPSLTNYRPVDHPWHYALWFSWKYINGVNYWEEERQTGKSAGRTTWAPPRLETRADGSATLHLAVKYVHPSGRVDVTELRTMRVSAPDRGGAYFIDWDADFAAGAEGAELGRTAMPGEPGGQVNGGYAGLSVRLASAPLTVAMVTTEGPVTEFPRSRARPFAAAVGCNLTEADRSVGSIALLSARQNLAEKAPWYLIRSEEMRFACAAILAPEVRKLPPHGEWKLRYRIALQAAPWTPESLRQAMATWGQ